MVSGVDTPSVQGPMIEASSNVALINQARQGAVITSSQLVVGKQFQAEVVAALTDGTYVVKVADIAARMQLPDSPTVGSKISLTLLSTTPRATFLLNPPDEQGTGAAPMTTNATLSTSVRQLIDEFNQSAAGGPSGTGSGTGTSAAGLYLQPGTAVTATDAEADPRLINVTTGQADSTPATLSSAGRLVNQLINDAPQQAPLASIARTPLLAAPDVNVNNMMSALKNGVSNSGVFYESHLLQWAEGSLPTEQLMKEPQASFPQQPGPMASAPQGQPPPAAANVTNNAAPTQTADTAQVSLPHEATPIVQQQLQTMEQQRFVWHGELWPGQTMDWEIAQQDEGGNSAAGQQEPTWQSSVKFELPTLGAVSAQLHLTGNRLRLQINTDNATSAVRLQNHAPELAAALESAGTKLDAMVVRRAPPTPPSST